MHARDRFVRSFYPIRPRARGGRHALLVALVTLGGLAACGLTPVRDERGLSAYAPPVTADGNVAASRAADHAAAMVGRPYLYGGQSPSTGFDCSGLVQYSYRRAGLRVPRETGDLLRHGRPVPVSELARGDLIFFDQEGKRASHVAVYLGGGRFVHAPSTGKLVRIDSLESAYWRRHMSDTRRYID